MEVKETCRPKVKKKVILLTRKRYMTGDFLIWRDWSVVVGHGERKSDCSGPYVRVGLLCFALACVRWGVYPRIRQWVRIARGAVCLTRFWSRKKVESAV